MARRAPITEELTLHWNGRTVAARWERSQRRSMELQIEPPGVVRCRTPWGVSQNQALRAMENRRDWILAGLEHFDQMGIRPHTYTDGDMFWYLGVPLQLAVVREAGQRSGVQVVGSQLSVVADNGSPAQVQTVLEQWYRKQAREYLPPLVAQWGRELGLQAQAVTITGARKRWGSCSAQGRLSFSWLLTMAPHSVVEYVVVHELCHLRVLNHSQRFWMLVQHALPSWQSERDWLRRYGLRFFWP